MREESLVRRVESLVTSFDYSRPFSLYLREHFRKNPQMGAQDRRMTREWCYNYFRIGKAVNDLSFRTRLCIGCYLCNNQSNLYLTYLLSDSPLKEAGLEKNPDIKLKDVTENYPGFKLEDIFPMIMHLSPEIDRSAWLTSFIIKPKVWIRIRKFHESEVTDELNTLSIPFETTGDQLTLSFRAEVQLEKTQSYLKGLFEIQDISSQHTSIYFNPKSSDKWWDACAGSGGKSLMLMEKADDIHIIATDVRPAILSNYSDRMKKAGNHNFSTQVFDFDPPGRKQNLNLPAFDGVLADVPCTGSGTWARSPDWNQVDISDKLKNHYIPLQRKIIARAVESLKTGKPLIYITCSVFKEENEENLDFFEQNYPLILEKSEYLRGFDIGADTLFVARFLRK